MTNILIGIGLGGAGAFAAIWLIVVTTKTFH